MHESIMLKKSQLFTAQLTDYTFPLDQDVLIGSGYTITVVGAGGGPGMGCSYGGNGGVVVFNTKSISSFNPSFTPNWPSLTISVGANGDRGTPSNYEPAGGGGGCSQVFTNFPLTGQPFYFQIVAGGGGGGSGAPVLVQGNGGSGGYGIASLSGSTYSADGQDGFGCDIGGTACGKGAKGGQGGNSGRKAGPGGSFTFGETTSNFGSDAELDQTGKKYGGGAGGGSVCGYNNTNGYTLPSIMRGGTAPSGIKGGIRGGGDGGNSPEGNNYGGGGGAGYGGGEGGQGDWGNNSPERPGQPRQVNQPLQNTQNTCVMGGGGGGSCVILGFPGLLNFATAPGFSVGPFTYASALYGQGGIPVFTNPGPGQKANSNFGAAGTSGCVLIEWEVPIPVLTNDNFYAAITAWFAVNNPGQPEVLTEQGPIKNWNVSYVTNMNSAFKNRTNFNQDLSAWNVSQVTDMTSMFEGVTGFSQTLSAWESRVYNVKSMASMFKNASVNGVGLAKWNTIAVTDMSSMFENSVNFSENLIGWKVKNVTNMSRMFTGTTVNQDLSKWNVQAVTDMTSMFQDATAFTADISSWGNVWAGNNKLNGRPLPIITNMFTGCTALLKEKFIIGNIITKWQFAGYTVSQLQAAGLPVQTPISSPPSSTKPSKRVIMGIIRIKKKKSIKRY
jgi:surface protein